MTEVETIVDFCNKYEQARNENKTICMVSNSPRRSDFNFYIVPAENRLYTSVFGGFYIRTIYKNMTIDENTIAEARFQTADGCVSVYLEDYETTLE